MSDDCFSRGLVYARAYGKLSGGVGVALIFIDRAIKDGDMEAATRWLKRLDQIHSETEISTGCKGSLVLEAAPAPAQPALKGEEATA